MKKISLTFDDGPTKYTSQILDVLKTQKVKSTFFVLGKNLEKYPEVAIRAHNEGHLIANHGWSHNRITNPLGLNWNEIKTTQNILKAINPTTKQIFRPPYGILSPLLKAELINEGYKIVMFDIVGHDWEENITVEKIVANIVDNLKNNGIILLHDGFGSKDKGDRSKTVEALPIIIKKIKEKGYEFTQPKNN